METNSYDFILAGGGMSAMALTYLMCKNKKLSQKKILIIDKDFSIKSDRTWCFWEKEDNVFEDIVFKKWNNAIVKGRELNKKETVVPYNYKMIRSSDFFKLNYENISHNPNIHRLETEILTIDHPYVYTSKGDYKAPYIFSSLYNPEELEVGRKQHFLWQHFLGWEVKVEDSVFDPQVFTYMDFSIPQKNGFCFVYVLPWSEREALIEYTVFSPDLWLKDDYRDQLKLYLRIELNTTGFTIGREEYGKIPMSNQPFILKNNNPNVINIGTIGGATKPSSGFTFLRTLRSLTTLVDELESGKVPRQPSFKTRHFFYDEILLNVLTTNKLKGQTVFEQLFQKNSITDIMKFLDEDTSLFEDGKIFKSLPTWPFFKAFLEELIN